MTKKDIQGCFNPQAFQLKASDRVIISFSSDNIYTASVKTVDGI